METVHRQLNNFDPSGPSKDLLVNHVAPMRKQLNHTPCSRCGGNHPSNSKNCLAIDKKCLKCGFVGHFRKYCKTRAIKRKGNLQTQNEKATKKFKSNSKSEVVDYIFYFDGGDSVTCLVGDVETEMIIDSGCKCNIICDVSWKILKSKGVHVENQVKKWHKEFAWKRHRN